jgi:hypothetical protein
MPYTPGALTRGFAAMTEGFQRQKELEQAAADREERLQLLKQNQERQATLGMVSSLRSVAEMKKSPARDLLFREVLGPAFGPRAEQFGKTLNTMEEEDLQKTLGGIQDLAIRNPQANLSSLRALVESGQAGMKDVWQYGQQLDKQRSFAKIGELTEGVPTYPVMAQGQTMGAPLVAPPTPTAIQPGGVREPVTNSQAEQVVLRKLQELNRNVATFTRETGQGLSKEDENTITQLRNGLTQQLEFINARLRPEAALIKQNIGGVEHLVRVDKRTQEPLPGGDLGPTMVTPQSPAGKIEADIQDLKNRGASESSPAIQAMRRELDAMGRKPAEDQFKSPEAKKVQDLESIRRVYGPGSAQEKMFLDQINTEKTGAKLSDASTMRAQYQHLAAPYITVRDAYNRVQAAGSDPSAAGDMALLYAYVKILDPTSAVRESEFATAAQAGSFGDRIKALVGKAQTGQRMSPEMRADFVGRARKLYAAQETTQRALDKQYEGIAKRAGVDPAQILGAEGERFILAPAPGGGGQAGGPVDTKVDDKLRNKYLPEAVIPPPRRR